MSTLVKPYVFTAGTYAVASQVNSDMDTIYSWINTNAIWADASIAFTNVPTGPNTDPTSANQLTRKSYVDAAAAAAQATAETFTTSNGIKFQSSMAGGSNNTPSNRPLLVNVGQEQAVGPSDGTGNAVCTYATAFPTATLAVVVTIGTASSGNVLAIYQHSSASASGFSVRYVNPSTAGPTPYTSSTFGINYIALGY